MSPTAPVAPAPERLAAHADDLEAAARVTGLLAQIHGAEYQFAVRAFRGATQFYPAPQRLVARFFLRTDDAAAVVYPGDLLRGPGADTRCRPADGDLHEITERSGEALWPGDTLCVDGRSRSMAAITGRGVYLEVSAPLTDYVAPRLTLLRNLPDRPGGCAAYPQAFRREALPPAATEAGAPDQRGSNRVNMHALDMRTDRAPPPSRHHHGPVPLDAHARAPHSETALILPRALYGLPPHAHRNAECVTLYPRPADDPAARVTVPVRPGSLVVSPATADWTVGHSFENAFAMLVAIPGFVSPYRYLP